VKFEKIEPGMVLYDVHTYKMGNTSVRSIGAWSVRILSVDRAKRSAQVSWNGNQAQTYYAAKLEKLKDKRPVLVRTAYGAYRRPTREEAKALKQAAKETT
jgi:hypothetical protein